MDSWKIYDREEESNLLVREEEVKRRGGMWKKGVRKKKNG